jgi:hypothetical protein
MKIDNLEYHGKDGAITSQVHGFTFTHDRECHVGKAWREGGDFTNACNCFLSRVDITEINGVPVGSVRQRWWEKRWVIFWSGYLACGLASFASRMFFGGAQ